MKHVWRLEIGGLIHFPETNGGVAKLAECLSSMQKALGSILNMT